MDAIKLLGSLLNKNPTKGNMLGSVLKSFMGGGGSNRGGGGGNALGMIAGLLGSGRGSSSGGGMGGLGILGSLLGGGQSQSRSGGGIFAMIMRMLGFGGKSDASQSMSAAASQLAPGKKQEAHDSATILIRAMCNAAKADGHVDESEQEAIIGRLGGDIDQAEAEFLRKELSSPLDVAAFARSVPSELAPNVYALSILTVKVDTREEVAYLKELGQELNLDHETLSEIHKQIEAA